MKAKRSFYNIIFGFISQVVAITFGIVIPRLFIVKFGSEVNGFMASMAQILVYMSILEAGVGTATIQSLYKPIGEEDKYSINSILSATSKYYKKTGKVYLLAVIALSILYPLCIKSKIGNLTVFLVILLTGMVGVVNYFFQSKFKLLLTAEGKGYIISNIGIIVTIFTNIIKISLLILGYNLILIQLSYFIINLLQMFMIWIYIKKGYKWIDLNVKPNYSALSQKNSVLIHQISYMIFNNTDVFILTIFCGLKIVSIYVMYNLIFQMINSLVSNINSGVVFILGSTYYEDKTKFLNLYDSYELYYMAIVFALYSITYILIIPFMRLYTVGMTDVNYIDPLLPVLFVALNLMSFARTSGVNAINIAGHFKKTQYRAIIEAIINIVISLICVNKFGIYGVLIGTIAALLYRTNDIIIYANKYILNRGSLVTYKRWAVDTILFLSIVITANKVNIQTNSYINFVKTAVILLIIIVPLFFIVASIFDIKSYKYTFKYVKKYSNLLIVKLKW
ncbi:sugar isomerase [Clostridium lacusfryxellense]|uniref:sugar isomerase n=1 Tax=Clostridium lacusfryxellense TaxID=205328 RepID=UPI001C0E2467|nr:sugar isomerase [Clostridium lacusfryxellense]MBU3110764.1 sugar isomerase [Clostridium lacusfryxellense]